MTERLLAIDLGLRTGLACFDDQGLLCWYRAHNLGRASRLRRAVYRLLREHDTLHWLVLEGDRSLADIWTREAQRRDIQTRRVAPETWRAALMPPRHRRSGADAKRHADTLARQLIDAHGAPKPTGRLRHDAAEAILIGHWGVSVARLMG